MFALNLLLIPVNLGGVLLSIRQAWASKKSTFGRTPKIQGRTAAPPRYLMAEVVILTSWLVGTGLELAHGRFLHAWFAFTNAAFLAYAVVRFIGLRDGWIDLTMVAQMHVTDLLARRARSSEMKSLEPGRTTD